MLTFGISFTAFEGYLFRYDSYPLTSGNSQQLGLTLSYPDILSVSLTEVVKNVENTSAFKLLMLEYPGGVKIEKINLQTIFNGQIEVQFYQETSGRAFIFSANGGPYHVSFGKWGTPTNPSFPQIQTREELLEQIAFLGLQWYYDRALEAYQNEVETTLEITDLIITIQAVNHSDYPGLQLCLMGLQGDESHSRYAFSAYFSPDGTLIDFSAR
ncbi:MAG: hypothetical protein LBB87_02980 [Nitrososphaerota archaeon]|nr:hypothetical protein [Nitrososphaerota archaeon]